MKKIAADRNYRMTKSAQFERNKRIAVGRRRMKLAFDNLQESFDIMVSHGGSPVVGIEWTGELEVKLTLKNFSD